MKSIIICLFILIPFNIAFAECEHTYVYGQIKKNCDNSKISTHPNSIEYTEIPYNANQQINKQQHNEQQVASLEQAVNQSYVTQENFKPTHTQLDQVRQLLDYAESQGCSWGGELEKPLLICPK